MAANENSNDQAYRLTPLGLFGSELHDRVIHLMQHHGDNAIVLNGGRLEWAKVEKS